jgi:hypothetical protein
MVDVLSLTGIICELAGFIIMLAAEGLQYVRSVRKITRFDPWIYNWLVYHRDQLRLFGIVIIILGLALQLPAVFTA